MATQQELTEAETAYHKLMLGHSAVEVRDQNGDMVRYTPANRQALQLYIQKLRIELGVVIPTATRPAGFLF